MESRGLDEATLRAWLQSDSLDKDSSSSSPLEQAESVKQSLTPADGDTEAVAGDDSLQTPSDLRMASNEVKSVKQGQTEIVATGRTDLDLLSLLQATPTGMKPDDLLRMGFTEAQIEDARVARLIQKGTGGAWCYAWHSIDIVEAIKRDGPLSLFTLEQRGCQRTAINAAQAEQVIKRPSDGKFILVEESGAVPTAAAEKSDKRPTFDELLKGRQLVITYSYFPFLPGKVSVGVRVGDDATKAAIESLDSAKVRFPDPVQVMIATQIEAADKRVVEEKATARKSTPPSDKAVKKTPAKSTASAKTKPTTPAAKKSPAKKAASTKKSKAK